MKLKNLFSIVFILLLLGLYSPASYSAVLNPFFTCNLANDAKTGANTYEFDIYLLRTGTDAFRLFAAQFDITFDNSVLNGGNLTASWVPESWDGANGSDDNSGPAHSLDATGQYGNPSLVLSGELELAPVAAGSNVSCAFISNVAPGTRIGRLLLTNDRPFIGPNLNLQFVFTGYGTHIAAYLNSTSSVQTAGDINANGTFAFSNWTDPLLPVELTSFVSNVNGRQVNLNWETKTEVNSSKYEIERALVSTKDATVTWSSVGTINAAGNSNSPKKYSYTDKNLQAGKYQYRLKMIDNDGSYKLSAVVETDIALPKSFQLSQNYPNPFNPSTKIDYQVPVDAKVIMEVYNITGQRVMELVNQEQSAGYYTVDFGASKLSSGVYIYRIVASDKATGNNFSSIKKMMLLK
jgi:hypothetical protein